MGSVKRSLPTGFDYAFVFCSDQTPPEVGAGFRRKCPALHAERRCGFGVLFLGGGDVCILEREVFHTLTVVYTMWEGWSSMWLSIKMKDKVLSLPW